MSTGDRVRVFPVGMSDKAAVGVVALRSTNGRSLAIGFDEAYVPFINAATGMAIHPYHGKMLLLSKAEDGVWRDVFSERAFVVEETWTPSGGNEP